MHRIHGRFYAAIAGICRDRQTGTEMKTVKVTRGQFQMLQRLTRKEVGTLKKYPKILLESKQLLRTCKKVIKKIESLPEHANKHKRQTAYKRIVTICQQAGDAVEK